MRRRDFITLLGAAAATWPRASGAQHPRPSRIGWLTTAPAADVSPFLDALRGGLAAQGYVDGRNLSIVAR